MKYQLLLLSILFSVTRAQGFDDKGNFLIPDIEQWNLESMIVKNGVLFSPVSKEAFSGLVFEMDGYGNVISERYYKDGVFNGYENRIEYFDKSSWSKKKRETFYFNGKKHGLFLEWDMYGDKVSVFEELNFLRQIIKDTEALKKKLEAYAVDMEYAHMATVDRNHAPNLKAFQQIAKEHGFDANDYITNKPYQKFTWGNK